MRLKVVRSEIVYGTKYLECEFLAPLQNKILAPAKTSENDEPNFLLFSSRAIMTPTCIHIFHPLGKMEFESETENENCR